MDGPLLLAFGTYRKQAGRLIDHGDGIVEVNDFQAELFQRLAMGLFPQRNSNDVTSLQSSVMTNTGMVLNADCMKAQEVLGLFAR